VKLILKFHLANLLIGSLTHPSMPASLDCLFEKEDVVVHCDLARALEEPEAFQCDGAENYKLNQNVFKERLESVS